MHVLFPLRNTYYPVEQNSEIYCTIVENVGTAR